MYTDRRVIPLLQEIEVAAGPPRGGYRRYTVPGPMTRRGAHENIMARYCIIVLKVPLNDVTCTGDFLTSRRPWVAGANGRVRFWPEVQLTLFLRMRTKKSPKHSENVFRHTSYSPVIGNRDHQCEWQGQIFDQRLTLGLQRIESFS